jgi:hypothetical protein
MLASVEGSSQAVTSAPLARDTFRWPGRGTARVSGASWNRPPAG